MCLVTLVTYVNAIIAFECVSILYFMGLQFNYIMEYWKMFHIKSFGILFYA